MTREEAVATLRRHADAFREMGVVRLALFGSLARGDDRPGSDVDVVVDIENLNDFSIIDHGSLRVMLCDILDREVDVVISDFLRPGFKERIRRDEVEVF